ncbi:MAG: hypothetical protein IH861_02680 [Chloroflexi bacterium]|nr:hypothetical protein [Chloroflexota bacterium]
MTLARHRIPALADFSRRSLALHSGESPSLRFVVLALGWWVGLSLGWVGAPVLVWLGGSILLTIGHAFSWALEFRQWRWRTGIVALALLGSLAMVPGTVTQAISGDWLPVAYFLVLFQAIASFEIRSRGGLYASVVISGAIFFFVSQLALDLTFIFFLTGFTTLFLSFLALSFLMDQVGKADVKWFEKRFSFAWFWTAVFVVSMVLSALIFLALPKQFSDPVNDTSGAFLPMKASESIQVPQASIDSEFLGEVLALNAETLASESPEPNGSPDSDGRGAGEAGAVGGDTERQGPPEESNADNSGRSGDATGGPGDRTGRRDGSYEASPGEFEGSRPGPTTAGRLQPLDIETGANAPFMQVRSPVLTYWRENVFDTFDGENWYLDRTSWFLEAEDDSHAIYTAPQPRKIRRSPRYNQTFFLKEKPPKGRIISGYAPVFASLPLGDESDTDDEDEYVYRVMSALPDFSIENLRTADPRRRLEYRYHAIPDSLDALRGFSDQITDGMFTDVDRLRRIVTFVDHNYDYDPDAADQLELTADPLEFLRDKEPGTSMDIATATVLLARSSGIPARLVTGYLPGRFDALSGTYVVRPSDSHAWAEIFIGGFGWVPFDSASRPESEQFGEGGTYLEPTAVNNFFSVDYSRDVYDSIRSSPDKLSDLFSGDLRGLMGSLAYVMGIILTLGMTGLIAWRVSKLIRRHGDRTVYAHLSGEGRQEVIKLYLGAEKLLKRAGLPARESSQTPEEYAAQVDGALSASAANDLADLRMVAGSAAYNPSGLDSADLERARLGLRRIKSSIKGHKGKFEAEKHVGPQE